MSTSPTKTSNRGANPWPTWVRALFVLVGVVASAAAGYAAALAVMIVAVLLDAAPLLAGETTPRQAWVTPTAVGAGAVVFGLGLWLSVRTFRRHRGLRG